MLRLLFYFFASTLIPLQSWSENKAASQVRWQEQLPVEFEYERGEIDANTDNKTTPRLVLRDPVSGTWVEANVQETSPGLYHASLQPPFSTAGTSAGYSFEVYVVPANANTSDIKTLFAQGQMVRKPYYVFQEGKTLHIQAYDLHEHLLQNYTNHLEDLVDRGIISRSTLGALMENMRAQQKDQMQKYAKEAEARRQAMEQTEQQKMLRRLEKERQLSEAERKQRKVEAGKLADQGLAAFKNEKYVDAEAAFRRATEIDPETSSYYYQYGISLYKVNKFTQSLSILDLANDPSINTLEKQYYRGLDLMKLKDFDAAWKEFRNVVISKDPTLAPPAAFFSGVIDFQLEKFDHAHTEFSWVIDHANDPAMAKQAENYLDQIANAKAFLAKKAKRWTVNVAGGMNYDSNILDVATANTATNLSGLRTTIQAFAEYRAIYEESHEWALQGNFSDVRSSNTDLSANSSYAAVDPQEYTLYLPYRWRGKLFGTNGQFTFSPGYEQINMDIYAVGNRAPIIDSWVSRLDWTYLESENHLEVYSGELRRDVSLIAEDSADQLSAYKATLAWNHTWFRDVKKESAWTLESSLADNVADGSNQSYYQLNSAGGFSQPLSGRDIINGKLGLSYSNYSQNTFGRTDEAFSILAGYRHPYTNTLSLLLSASYLNNNSTESLYAYSKYTMSVSLVWLTDL